MKRAWTVMTALPPTKGHLNLIRFGASLGADKTVVLICTSKGEPFQRERYEAVKEACEKMPNVEVRRLFLTMEDNPELPGFWDYWKRVMEGNGVQPGDLFFSSELYGRTMAEVTGMVFMPYDPNRELYYTKATKIRENLTGYFHDILPEFQKHLRTTVTVFGAESTGKTTLSKELAIVLNAHWVFEWARPYLETVGPEIHVPAMNAIHVGQRAVQDSVEFMYDKPFVVQDTDLFSTVGYWLQPHWEKELGPVPNELIEDALARKSDLYIITRSNIPFERDTIRYGVDKRESPDEFWIGVAEGFGLNYVVLDEAGQIERISWAAKYAREVAAVKADAIFYDRGVKEVIDPNQIGPTVRKV